MDIERIDYYQAYIDGVISLTEGYAEVTQIVLDLNKKLADDVNDDSEELDEAENSEEYLNLCEFYNTQHDLFAHRIAHNFMLANDYMYFEGIYIKNTPKAPN